MAAGITDKLWDVADLVRVIEEWEHGRLISHLREAMLHPLNQISRPGRESWCSCKGALSRERLMTLPQAPLQVQMTYEDRPEISEPYADLLGRVYHEGITLRLEFIVNRLDNAQSGQPITGKAYTASRVVIPLTAILDMINKLQAIASRLQASGALRPVYDISAGSQKPN